MVGLRKFGAVLLVLTLIAAGCSSGEEDLIAEASDDTGEVEDAEPSTEPTPGVDTPSTTAFEQPEDDDPAGSAETVAPDPTDCTAGQRLGSRVDVRQDGNRISDTQINLAEATVIDIEVPGTPIWILAEPTRPGEWYVALDDGSAVRVGLDSVSDADAPESLPPLIDPEGIVSGYFDDHALFANPLFDGRVVESEGLFVVLSEPTDRLDHGVLGDAIEAAAIEWVNACDETSGTIEIAEPDVIEGISPIIADVDDDGAPEIVVTLSNSSDGARLAAFELDGSVTGESEPIGRGNRWRNQLAAGPFGPDGQTEIVDIRTPHIGGTVQAFQLIDGSLELVAASDARYTTHEIGSRNLDMGIAIDASADGQLDAVVATSDLSALVALTRTGDGWTIVAERGIDGRLTTNIAVQSTSDGQTQLAVGAPGKIRVWTG